MRSTRKGEPIGFDHVPVTPFWFPEDDWHYRPQAGSFRYEMHGDYTESVWHGVFEVWGSLDEAIARFASHGLPQREGSYCWVLDSANVVILGYVTSVEAALQQGTHGWWIGVEAAFQELERLHDPMEVAIWETMAKEYVW